MLIMDSLKTALFAFIYGLWDSVKGIILIFYIDEEIHRQNEEKASEREKRMLQRSPSPVPSSAAAMFVEELQRERSDIQKDNPDERSVYSIMKKPKTSKPGICFKEKKIAIRTLKCCALNGGFTCMSMILYYNLCIPTLMFMLTLCHGEDSQDLPMIQEWVQYIVDIMFRVMWIVPIFLLSKIISSLWFNDIAAKAYKVRKGKPNLIPSVSKLAADFVFNLLVQVIFLVQTWLVKLLPFSYVAEILYWLHLCVLYSLYSFEYKWFNMGWELHRRLSYIEINWPYFVGFGLPLTLLSNMSSSIIVSSSIFSIFFPLFILSGNEAKPLVGTTETPLRIFSPTIFVSNILFGVHRSKITANKKEHQKQHDYQQHHLKSENDLNRRSSTVDKSPTLTPTQFRYPQPPQRISPARLPPERNFRSDFSRPQIRYNEGTRTLIPTPVLQVSRTTTLTGPQIKSTNQRRIWYNSGTMRWTVHLDGGPRRVNHAAVCVGDFIYSFGGYCTGDDYRFNESIDVHVLNTQTLRWTLLPQRRCDNGTILKYPEVPFQRYGHTAVTYKDKIYMWGGRNDETLCNVLYCFDPKSLSWSRPQVTGAIPGSRDGHSACVIDNCMYIFGGFVEEIHEFSCDVHALNFDTMEWRYIQTFGVPPSFRDFHTAEHIQGRMYIFGGRGDKHSPYHSQEEMYCPEIVYLDLKTKVWHRPSTTGKVPVGRRSHSMFIYKNLIYVFGGYNGLLDQHFNDLYTFDPKANCWNLVKPHGKPPTPRRRQVGIVKESRLFLFGGTSPYPHEAAQEQAFLIDNNDINILDFKPNLKTLAILAVVEHRIDTTWLPRELRLEIKAMTQPNSISRPINHAG